MANNYGTFDEGDFTPGSDSDIIIIDSAPSPSRTSIPSVSCVGGENPNIVRDNVDRTQVNRSDSDTARSEPEETETLSTREWICQNKKNIATNLMMYIGIIAVVSRHMVVLV